MTQRSRLAVLLFGCTLAAAAAAAQDSAGPGPITARDRAAARRQQLQAEAQRLAHQSAQARRDAARAQTIAERSRRARREAEVRSWPAVTDTFAQTVRLGRNGTLDLHNVVGDIIVTGGRGNDAHIAAVKRVRHPREPVARGLLPSLRILVSERGGNVDIRTERPRRGDAVASVDYTIAVPSTANVTLRTISGDVTVTNLDGELRVNAASGNVTTSNVRRVRQITTVSGNVDVADGETDEFSANTIGGDVTLRNMKGRRIDLNSVHGNVRLVGVDAARARLQSMAGDLEYAGNLARDGRYEFQTHSGNIRLNPLRNPGFDLEAVTLNGAVRSDFEVKVSARPATGGMRRVLRGTVGDAGAVVTAQSFSGDILIVRRQP